MLCRASAVLRKSRASSSPVRSAACERSHGTLARSPANIRITVDILDRVDVLTQLVILERKESFQSCGRLSCKRGDRRRTLLKHRREIDADLGFASRVCRTRPGSPKASVFASRVATAISEISSPNTLMVCFVCVANFSMLKMYIIRSPTRSSRYFALDASLAAPIKRRRGHLATRNDDRDPCRTISLRAAGPKHRRLLRRTDECRYPIFALISSRWPVTFESSG